MGYDYKLQLGTEEQLPLEQRKEIRDYFHSISEIKMDEEEHSGSQGLGTGMKDFLEYNLLKLSDQYLDITFFVFLSYWDMINFNIYEIRNGRMNLIQELNGELTEIGSCRYTYSFSEIQPKHPL